MPIHDKKLDEFAKTYAELMDEARERLNAIGTIYSAVGPFVPTYVSDESAYTQLRMVCEIIAIGCLVAHGNIPATRAGKLLKASFPTTIIPELEALHPGFYPLALTIRDGVEKPVESGYLTKQGLLDLYGECGNELHWGNLKKLLKGNNKKPKQPKIQNWRNQAITLLKEHTIRLASPETLLHFTVNEKNTNYFVFTALSTAEYEAILALEPKERMARLARLRRTTQ